MVKAPRQCKLSYSYIIFGHKPSTECEHKRTKEKEISTASWDGKTRGGDMTAQAGRRKLADPIAPGNLFRDEDMRMPMRLESTGHVLTMLPKLARAGRGNKGFESISKTGPGCDGAA